MKSKKRIVMLNVKNVKRNITKWMKENDISKVSFARAIGMTPASITLITNGSRSPSIETACRIIAATGLTFEELCK